MKTSRQDIRLTVLVVIITLFIIGLIVTAVEDKSVVLNGYSAVFYCAAIAIGVQWLAWLPSSLKQTERFYDLAGGLTYLAIIGFSLWAGSQTESPSAREWIVSLLVAIWSFRLSWPLSGPRAGYKYRYQYQYCTSTSTSTRTKR